MKRTPLRAKKGFSARSKPLPARSAKRKAYRASEEGDAALAHMGRVKTLPCVCCNAPPPNDAHHCRSDFMARDDWKVIPLCKRHHTGAEGYHRMKKSWEAKYGKDHSWLKHVDDMLRATYGET